MEDIKFIETNTFTDARGTVRIGYDTEQLKKIGIKERFTQQLISESKYGALRGLHYQKHPYEQSKLIQCLRGTILLVVLDIREKSINYGKHHEILLFPAINLAVYVPKGFAVGYIVISKENAIVHYNIAGKLNLEAASGYSWHSKELDIDWIIKPKIISEKDERLPEFVNQINDNNDYSL